MSVSTWLKTPSSRVAAVVLVAAVALLGWTIANAFRIEQLPSAPTSRIASIESMTHRVPRPTTDIQAAVDNDLFSPERESPGGSYRMPGEPDPAAKTVDVQKPIVLGTAVATDGQHFATVQLAGAGDNRPTLVRIGDKIGTWVVRAIERGKVTFVSTDGVRADVAVPKPGT